MKIPWRGAHRIWPSQKWDKNLWRGIAWNAWMDQQLHLWYLGKYYLDQASGLYNLNSKPSPSVFVGVFIYRMVVQAGSQDWDQNCFTASSFQVWTNIQKNCGCHDCSSSLFSFITLQYFGRWRGNMLLLLSTNSLSTNELNKNYVRWLINRDEQNLK